MFGHTALHQQVAAFPGLTVPLSLLQNSGIESLVEELCSRLKELQDKQKGEPSRLLHPGAPVGQSPAHLHVSAEEKPIRKKSDGCQSPERAASPSSKDQVEM